MTNLGKESSDAAMRINFEFSHRLIQRRQIERHTIGRDTRHTLVQLLARDFHFSSDLTRLRKPATSTSSFFIRLFVACTLRRVAS